ncbi:MAG: glycosyltransferase family 4 protein, partial [Pirellulales bacterium]
RGPIDEVRRRIARLVADARPDLLHANSLAMGRLSGPVARGLGVSSVSHLRDILSLSRRAIDDLNCHCRLVAVSQAVRDFYVTAGLDGDRTSVAHNGVDTVTYAPRQPTRFLHCELGLSPHTPLIASIGQIGLRKGIDLFLDMAHDRSVLATGAHFLIVGVRHSRKGESVRLEASLRQVAGEGPLAGRVHFLGYRTDIPALLNELTLVVHAARQEPLGRVLIEAAASGLPIVATDVGGTREIFPPGTGTAWLVPKDNRSAMARGVATLLADHDRRSMMGAAARNRAVTAFTVHQAASRLIELYAQIASGLPDARNVEPPSC